MQHSLEGWGVGVNEEEPRAQVARITYAYVRWLLICLPTLLFVVTIVTALQQGELERSISAYYGGPVQVPLRPWVTARGDDRDLMQVPPRGHL